MTDRRKTTRSHSLVALSLKSSVVHHHYRTVASKTKLRYFFSENVAPTFAEMAPPRNSLAVAWSLLCDAGLSAARVREPPDQHDAIPATGTRLLASLGTLIATDSQTRTNFSLQKRAMVRRTAPSFARRDHFFTNPPPGFCHHNFMDQWGFDQDL